MSAPEFGVPEHVTAHATRVLAPNPSPMTLDGTNTWIIGPPAEASPASAASAVSASGEDAGPLRDAAIVDPGPLHEDHLQAVARAARDRGLRVAVVLITHRHADHTEGAARFAQIVGAPIRSVDAGTLAGGDVVDLDGLSVHVVATPGHTSDSVCLHVPADASLLTGDTVLGRGTTVVAWPDGRLGDYLDSLQALRALVGRGEVDVVLPAHGDPVAEPARVLEEYLAHRRSRLQQVREAVADLAEPTEGQGGRPGPEAGGDDTDALVEAVVERVYAQVPREVWPAARLFVRAQLDHLRESGQVD